MIYVEDLSLYLQKDFIMTDDKRYIDSLLKLVERRSELSLSTLSNLNHLVGEIKESTSEKLSISTLRRLFGMVESAHEPSISTLDILSRFVGFRGWHDFVEHKEKNRSQSQFLNEQVLRCDQLEDGAIVELEWPPARLCRLKSLGYGRFEVLLSINSKLAEGDMLCAKMICVGQPFIATDIVRKGRHERVYVAGRDDGISALRVQHYFV